MRGSKPAAKASGKCLSIIFMKAYVGSVLPIHALLKAEFFIEFGHFIECLATRTFRLSPVGENIFGPHPAMGTDFPVRNVLLIEKLYKMRPRDIEQVGRLLSCQLGCT